jgi:hypothetical protein
MGKASWSAYGILDKEKLHGSRELPRLLLDVDMSFLDTSEMASGKDFGLSESSGRFSWRDKFNLKREILETIFGL